MPVVPPPWREYTWDGHEGYLWDAKLFISKDYTPETGIAMAFFAPPGGRAAVPAMVQGDPGLPITIRNVITNELAYNDATPASFVFTLITPGTATVQPVYDVTVTLHAGAPGGATPFSFLNAVDLVGNALAGYVPTYTTDTGLAVGGSSNGTPGIVWSPPRVGGVYWPAIINSTTSANGAQRSLASVSVPAFVYPVQLEPHAACLLTGTGSDCVADLLVRVGDVTNGDVISRRPGLALSIPRDMTLIPGPMGGGASSVGKIAANTGPTTVTLRAERQSGSDSFATNGSQTTYYVKAVPLP